MVLSVTLIELANAYDETHNRHSSKCEVILEI